MSKQYTAPPLTSPPGKISEAVIPPQNIPAPLGGGDFIDNLESIAQDISSLAMQARTVRTIQGAMDAERIKKAFTNCPT